MGRYDGEDYDQECPWAEHVPAPNGCCHKCGRPLYPPEPTIVAGTTTICSEVLLNDGSGDAGTLEP
jgi:hypothetical protein